MAAACDILTHDETPPPSDREKRKEKSNPISQDPLARLVSLFSLSNLKKTTTLLPNSNSLHLKPIPSLSAAHSAARMETDLRTTFFLSGSSFFAVCLSVHPTGKSNRTKRFPIYSSHPPFHPPSIASVPPIFFPQRRLSQTFLAVRENWPL